MKWNATQQMLCEAAYKHIHIGDSVTIKRRAIGKDGSWIIRRTDHGTVIGVYKHHFLVQIGKTRECFRFNEVFGNEAFKVEVKQK